MRTNRLSIEEIQTIMGKIKLRYNPDEDTMKLIETDLTGGMSPEDVYKYCSNKISFIRKKIISESIRRGYSEETIKKISSAGTKTEDLEVIFSLMEKGVNIALIEKISANHEGLMDYSTKLSEGLLTVDEINKVSGNVVSENEVAEEEDKRTAAGKIESTGVEADEVIENSTEDKTKTFFDNKKSDSDISSEKNDEETKEKHADEIINKEADTPTADKADKEKDNKKADSKKSEYANGDNTQQKGISDADINKFLEGLKSVFEEAIQKSYQKREESDDSFRKEFSDQITELKDKLDIRDRFIQKQFQKINELSGYKKKSEELEYELKTTEDVLERYKRLIEEEKQSRVINENKAHDDNISEDSAQTLVQNNIYNSNQNTAQGSTINVPDSDDKVIQFSDRSGKKCSAVLEYTSRKNSGVGRAIAAFACKKRSRRSLVQLVIAGELSAEQLNHIVTAIKSGLTEEQLCNLVENKVPADKMPQIIQIAMLENKMGYTA